MMQRFQPYFDKVWKNATELRFCVSLQLDRKRPDMCTEGYRKERVSNHADTEHWFLNTLRL